MTPLIRKLLCVALGAAALATAPTCTSRGESTEETRITAATASQRGVRRLALIEGLDSPEAVKYDPDQDVYFISNILGFGSVKDGAAYIVRVSAADPSHPEVFIQSGVNGVTLDAPKGMALQGDTLWVADIDILRAFDRRTGAPLAEVDLSAHQAVLLNDLAVGPDGALYITDSGIVMNHAGVIYTGGDKIFVVGRDHSVSVLAQGEVLGHPNGIAWHPSDRHWIVASFGHFQGGVYALSPDGRTRTVLVPGEGRFDGIEVLADGRILASSWNDSSVSVIRNGEQEHLIRHLSQPAALGVDTRRNRLAVPLVLYNRVEFWELPSKE